MPRRFFKRHGVGMVVKKHLHEESGAFHYEIKWLKSEERMRFFREDLIIVSNVDR